MTRNTSEVAVCCSKASVSSRVRACSASNRRAFSIAISAWSAKVVTSSICFSVNGSTTPRISTMTRSPCPRAARNSEQRTIAAAVTGLAQGVFGLGERVDYMNRAPLERDAAAHRAAIGRNRILPQVFDASRIDVLAGGRIVAAAVELHDIGLLGMAEPLRRLRDSVEHGLHVRRRAGDDVKDLADGGLIFERFLDLARARLHLVEQATFSIAITAWSAKVWTNSICLSVNGLTSVRCKEDRANWGRLHAAAVRPIASCNARAAAPRCAYIPGRRARRRFGSAGLPAQFFQRPSRAPVKA